MLDKEIIDYIIANPTLTQKEVAKYFRCSVSAVFQARKNLRNLLPIELRPKIIKRIDIDTILALINKEPNIQAETIAQRLGCHLTSVYDVAKKLILTGKITQEQLGWKIVLEKGHSKSVKPKNIVDTLPIEKLAETFTLIFSRAQKTVQLENELAQKDEENNRLRNQKAALESENKILKEENKKFRDISNRLRLIQGGGAVIHGE